MKLQMKSAVTFLLKIGGVICLETHKFTRLLYEFSGITTVDVLLDFVLTWPKKKKNLATIWKNLEKLPSSVFQNPNEA